MKRYGGTFSGGKIHLGVPAIEMVGYECSAEGRRITKSATAKITKWPPCRNVTEVRGFLGVVGICRNWIKGYGLLARPLYDLTKCTNREFEWTDVHAEAMERVKAAVLASGAIRPVDYTRLEEYPPILAINASQIGCGIELAQMGEDGKRYPARFMSKYYNSVQQRYSQPKLELYGIYVGMQAARLYVVEQEACAPVRVWGDLAGCYSVRRR